MLNEEPSPAIENTDDPAVAKKDDPAFLYFPTNYRWSMGLLICLSGAPWTGVEIDEVNRVGRALTDKVGDDDAWFEERSRAFWSDAVQRMRVAFARGAFGEGIAGAVQSVGSRLAKKFPRQVDDVNEIDNEITTDDTEKGQEKGKK